MTELGQFAGEVSAPPAQPPQPARPPAKPGRGWTAMLGVIAALFVVLTVVTTAVVALGGKTVTQTGTQPGTQPGTDTPQAAVQGWAAAMEAGNLTTADTYLSSTRRSDGTTSAELVMSVVYSNARVTNVVIGSTNTNGNQATVSASVDLVQTNDGPTMSAGMTFRMIRESSGWKIDGLDYAPI
jgi:hypothetical protein